MCIDKYSLGTLLIALRGLNTLTVRIADKLKFSVTIAYSIVLKKINKKNNK